MHIIRSTMISTAQALRARLISCGKIQMEIAAGSGVNQSTVSRIIKGKVDPSSKTVDKLNMWLDSIGAKTRSKRGN